MGDNGKMKAVRFHAAKDIRVEEVDIPQVKQGWVRLKPAFVGICGSDLHEYEDGPHIIPKDSPHRTYTSRAVSRSSKMVNVIPPVCRFTLFELFTDSR